ncbi:MAG: hypothetical protein LBN36_00085, partial [Clostridiales Family XIII bacterium]|nr:hypothetical protein [Clostridiales Family XIII bacterium]
DTLSLHDALPIFDDYIHAAERRALYASGRTAVFGDELIVLSTCEYTYGNGRLVMVAKRIPNEAAPEYPKP